MLPDCMPQKEVNPGDSGTFALETLPLHFSAPIQILQVLRAEAGSFRSIPWPIQEESRRTLGSLHRTRLGHSCRLLGLEMPGKTLWQELEALRPQLRLDQKKDAKLSMYSLRYSDECNASYPLISGSAGTKSSVVAAGRAGRFWILLRRDNSYPFFPNTFSKTLSPRIRQFSSLSRLPDWALVPRVGVSASLRLSCKPRFPGQGSSRHAVWQAKSQWQVRLLQNLQALQAKTYRGCEDLLCFAASNAWEGQPLLQEGMKSNVFLLNYQAGRLLLRTPRARGGTRFLCGTTRNWLCRTSLPAAITVQQKDLNIDDLLQADGVMIGNAAMGLRFAEELFVPKSALETFENLGSQTLGLPDHCPEDGSRVLRYNLEPFIPLCMEILALYWATIF